MKLLFAAILILTVPTLTFGQIKKAFEEKLDQEQKKKEFRRQLIQLDSVFKGGVDTVSFQPLAVTGRFDYVLFDIVKGDVIAKLDIIPLLAEVYFQMEDEGKVAALKKLRAEGKLKIVSRNIANEVLTLPKKTNPRQSYNDFYLGVIRQLMAKYKSILAADQLDFATYKLWEKEAAIKSDTALREFREAFIIFLYSHYHLQ